jgi:hypothetical protein
LFESYATGLSAIVLLAVLSFAVHMAWRRIYPEGRSGCHGCADTSCDKHEEEVR